MKVNQFEIPMFLSIGTGELSQVCQILSRSGLNISRCGLVLGKKTRTSYGEEVLRQLKANNLLSAVFTPDDTALRTVTTIAEQAILDNIDTFIGVGGGRVLDIAKYAAYMTRTYFISIPTAVAHDGLASPIAVLEDSTGKTRSLGCRVPSGLIIDLDVVRAAPVSTRRAGLGDVLSNLTALHDWKRAVSAGKDSMNHFAYILSEFAARSVLHYQDSDLDADDFLAQLVEAQVLSGLAMSIAGSSRPCSGAEHLFSHAIDELGFSRHPHGIQVAVGAILIGHMQGLDVRHLMDFLGRFGLPRTPQEAGFTREECLVALERAPLTRPNRFTVLNEADVSHQSLNRFLDEIEDMRRGRRLAL